MAVGLEAWNKSERQVGAIAEPAKRSRVLTLQERQARLHRRRRLSRAHALLEGAIWLAGSGAIVFLTLAGMTGLR